MVDLSYPEKITPEAVLELDRPTDRAWPPRHGGDARDLRTNRAGARTARLTPPAPHSAAIAAGFLCPLSATTYSVDFLEFEVVDDETNSVIFKVARDPSTSVPAESIGDLDPEVEASIRTIRYSFPRELLQSQSIRTSYVRAARRAVEEAAAPADAGRARAAPPAGSSSPWATSRWRTSG